MPDSLTRGYLYIPGAIISQKVDSAGILLIENVPEGDIQVVYFDVQYGSTIIEPTQDSSLEF